MSVELNEALTAINNTGNPSLQDLAKRAYEYKTALESGQLSKSEYTELVTDLYHEKNINEAVQDLQLKEYINTTMNALINLASLY
jgi:RNA polymerase-interacting CarD/CdnL/TRCF family regulator